MITLIYTLFLIGYLAIALEHTIRINKAATALILGVVIWTIYITGATWLVPILSKEEFEFFLSTNPTYAAKAIHEQCIGFIANAQLVEQLGEICSTLFFLIGAMTIVEIVDLHGGFDFITNRIRTQNKHKLLWIIVLVSFFMSAVLDNMTTAIVMIMLVRRLIIIQKERWIFAGAIIIAANSGGAWSPIGDITTIMLWMSGNINAQAFIPNLILPSIVSVIVPTIIANRMLHGVISEHARITGEGEQHDIEYAVTRGERVSILVLGVGGLLFTPIFKTFTHLPPYMGILLALGIIWFYTEILYRKKRPTPDAVKMRVPDVLKHVDMPTILFFLGILLAVAGLQCTGILNDMANVLNKTFHNVYIIDLVIGAISSIVDNVPLVAGAIGMYPLVDPETLSTMSDPAFMSHFVEDGTFWEFLAYCSGVGGSLLIIGSAAGVVVMGIEKINFMWYMKHFSLLALLGYLAGAGVYIGQQAIFH
ncbi:MAG: sodium:proton antiporter NhaD [Marinifilaceae bacterium]